MSSSTFTPDPSNASRILPEPSIKKCMDCRANLPLSSFGRNKRTPDGYMPICKLCKSQYIRLYTKKRYQSVPRTDDHLIRSLRAHNASAISHMISNPPITNRYSVYGFDVDSFESFKGTFTIHQTQFHFSLPGISELYVASSDPRSAQAIADILVRFNVRLELSPAHVTYSAREIYGKTL